jgi:hypothetical protein
MARFLLPVEGLTLADDWRLGAVVLRSQAAGPGLVDDWAGTETERHDAPLPASFARVAETLRAGTIADVTVDGTWTSREGRREALREAMQRASDALDLLRVFQYQQAHSTPTSFGLPGDLRAAFASYLAFGLDGPPGSSADTPGDTPTWAGFVNDGDVKGTVLDETARVRFATAPLSRLGSFVGRPLDGEGPRRARFGVRLLSSAIREYRPTMRTMYVVMAVEAFLGRHRTFELAQRSAALTCGARTGDTCGRTRDACVWLKADLTDRTEARRVRRLVDQPTADVLCSEWFGFLARYEARSAVAHGNPAAAVSGEDAQADLHWAVHSLLDPALTHLLDHPDDPGGALADDIGRRPASHDAMLLLGRAEPPER